MKHFTGLANQKTGNVVDYVILSIVITYSIINDCMYSYIIIYLEISVTGQCQTNIYLA